jgi:hypothetical protein
MREVCQGRNLYQGVRLFGENPFENGCSGMRLIVVSNPFFFFLEGEKAVIPRLLLGLDRRGKTFWVACLGGARRIRVEFFLNSYSIACLFEQFSLLVFSASPHKRGEEFYHISSLSMEVL